MNRKQIDILILITIAILIILGNYLVYDNYFGHDTIRIANWNLDVFGPTKSSNINLMKTYAGKIENYDIVFVQEIRDISNASFPELCLMLANYSCLSSSRAGRSSSKEQYGIIYRDGINVTSFRDFNPDSLNRWERPPIEVSFDVNGYRLNIYNIHTKPDDTQKELGYLEDVIGNYGNVIVLGDLNADCSYYNNRKETEFDSWHWAVKDYDDTTSSTSTKCAYDRILLNNDAYHEFESYGVDKKGITEKVSDHDIVWVKMRVD